MAKRKARRDISRDKRVKVDVWVTDGLRASVALIIGREDGKPANDLQVRSWAQKLMDDATAKAVDKFEELMDGLP